MEEAILNTRFCPNISGEDTGQDLVEGQDVPDEAQDEAAPSEMPPSNAQALDAQQWHEVVDINKLLHGFQVRKEVPDIVRARRAAFVLKETQLHTPVGFDTAGPVELKPCFQVVDGSNIKVQETKTAFQRSLALNAFSEKAISGELSAGDATVSAGISGERGHSGSTATDRNSSSESTEYYAAYNFPRARLFLDQYELRLSEECECYMKAIESDPKIGVLEEFEAKFGHVFVTSVLLGGQQRTVKLAGAVAAEDNGKKQDAVRGALGAKIAAPYLSASLNRSSQRGSGSAQTDKQYTDLSYLAMSATGGDTLIGPDIASWARSVADPKNWRVIENEIAVPLANLIASCVDKGHIPGMFQWIRNGCPPFPAIEDAKFSYWFDKNYKGVTKNALL